MAIKVICKGRSEDMTGLPVFSLSQQLRSHFIVKYVEHFEDDSFVYLVTSWMPLGDLRSRMSRQKVGHLTEGEMHAPLSDVANALKIVHALGLTHNAVQPKNIFIEKTKNSKSRVKLMCGESSQSSQAQ
jgi:serine/threonine protein kinase